ncbi:MAG: putative AMP-dependent synthetase [Hyphomicrobiales bacterium]|nr:putative AMP-dependent synthetase [Hyphomicrobiales bacterium]
MTAAATALATFPRPLGFSALLDGAARLRPDRPALSDQRDTLTFAEFDARVSALAAQLSALELGPPARALLLGGASASAVVLAFAALRAGLDLALVPAHLEPEDLARHTAELAPSILLVDPFFQSAQGEEAVLALAGAQQSVRVICSLQPIDGAVMLDMDRTGASGWGACNGSIFLRSVDETLRVCAQAELLQAGLDIATQGRIRANEPILSTLSPMSFAGLVAGPIAALLAGAQCALHAPFESTRLSAEFDMLAPCHVVAPARIASLLVEARVIAPEACASLIVVHDGAVPATLAHMQIAGLDFTPRAGVDYSLEPRLPTQHPLALLGERMRARGPTAPLAVKESHARD